MPKFSSLAIGSLDGWLLASGLLVWYDLSSMQLVFDLLISKVKVCKLKIVLDILLDQYLC